MQSECVAYLPHTTVRTFFMNVEALAIVLDKDLVQTVVFALLRLLLTFSY